MGLIKLMRRAGRANWIMVTGLVGVLAIVVLLLFSGQSPSAAAAEFMTALGKGDVNELARLSYMEDDPPEKVREQWEYATKVVAPYYRFRWQILGETRSDDTHAAVRMYVWRDAQIPTTYEENYQLPMVKIGKEWKVDVRGMNRTMYPGLPR